SLKAPEAFELLKDQPFCFFLDSGMDPEKLGRYSFMGSDPFLVLKSSGKEITLLYGDRQETVIGNPFDVLGQMLEKYALDPSPFPIPLIGGAVGYLSYDLCHFVEHLPSTAIDDLKLPECYIAFYDAIIAFDHLEGRTYIAATGFPEMEEASRRRKAQERIDELRAILAGTPCPEETIHSGVVLSAKNAESAKIRANFTHEEYVRAVAAAREYIANGDIFQVNLSQRFEVDLPIAPYELYRKLRFITPAPFA
ncbi:unnamed protein product, partial [marine sediment metagenome]